MSIEDLLSKAILCDGPMRLDRFMSLLSSNYYGKGDVFGEKGDFITSPEIDKSFAHAIYNWLHEIIISNNIKEFQLIELGSGNGTLMCDLLNRISEDHNVFSSLKSIGIIEKSMSLISKQREKLSSYNVSWLEGLSEIKNLFTIIIANEFFDALPIRQFINEKDGWKEIFIGFGENGFYFVKSISPLVYEGKVGDIKEYSYQSKIYAEEIARVLKDVDGRALIIDYGYESEYSGATLQAVSKHKAVDLLGMIGSSDWSAHVDFHMLGESMKMNNLNYTISTQRDFLIRYGIQELMKGKGYGLNRLIGEDQMGILFKVMDIHN